MAIAEGIGDSRRNPSAIAVESIGYRHRDPFVIAEGIQRLSPKEFASAEGTQRLSQARPIGYNRRGTLVIAEGNQRLSLKEPSGYRRRGLLVPEGSIGYRRMGSTGDRRKPKKAAIAEGVIYWLSQPVVIAEGIH